jgi:hypothetical protein
MRNLAEKSERNAATIETEEKKWELFENTEARLRDQEHFKLAYEWLKRRGKIVLLKGVVESC